MNNGEITSKFAADLQGKLPGGYEVFFDHGKKGIKNVCECKGVIGQTLNHETRIAEFDIVILKNKELFCIIEIEESGTLSPKKIFGDYMALSLIDTIFLKDNKPLAVDQSTFRIIAGLYNEKGNSSNKIDNILALISKICDKLPKIILVKCKNESELLDELNLKLSAICI